MAVVPSNTQILKYPIMKAFFVVSHLFLLVACSTAQPSIYNTSDKKAKKYMAKADECMKVSPTKMYPDVDCAIENTKLALERDPNFTDGWVKMGEYYHRKGHIENSIMAYNKVLSLDPNYSSTGMLYYHTAKLEMEAGKYEACLKHAERYLQFRNVNETFAADCERYAANCKFARKALKNPKPFEPKNVGNGVNTENHEYFPALTGDDQMLLFTRLIPDSRIPENMGGKQEDFFVSEWKSNKWSHAYSVSPKINSKFNEGAPTLSSDGRVLIFTGCEFMDQGYGGNRTGKGSCDLFYSFKVGDTWTQPDNFGPPLNSWNWESQPSFSSDGKTLYFIMGIREQRARRNLNKQDIYSSTFIEGKGWSKPEKLGPTINTPFREESVFIHPDGQTLYFSSDGHPGMGGLDIYMSRKQKDGTWGPAINLGYPINTHDDENSLLVGADGKIAYFASDRPGGFGGLDIYGFELYPEARPVYTTYMKGIVFDAETKKPLDASFKLIDLASGDTIMASVSDKISGEFLVSIPVNKEYALFAERPGYVWYSKNFTFTGEEDAKGFVLNVPLNKSSSKGEKIVLENVFFDLDKDVLKPESKFELDKLVKHLSLNPEMKIQLRGHTDNQGDADYNLGLSDRRAKAVMKYLIDKGIDAKRLSAKGFGETEPIDTNDTSEGRAKNRRTEYLVL